MPLIRKVSRIRKGDLLVVAWYFNDDYDHFSFDETEMGILEVFLVEARYAEEEGVVEAKEICAIRYDPRALSGYNFYMSIPMQYHIECQSIVGAVNGSLDKKDRVELRQFMRRMLNSYRGYFEDLYYRLGIEEEEEEKCPW